MKISQMIAVLAQRLNVEGDIQVGINMGKEFKHIANSFTITSQPDEKGNTQKFVIFSDTPADEIKASLTSEEKKAPPKKRGNRKKGA